MQDADQEQPGRDQLPARSAHPSAGGLLVGRPGGALSLDVRDAESGRGEEEIDLLGYWRIFLKRKWTVLATLAIVFFTVLVATLLMTPIYRATATLQIDLEPTKVVEVGATTTAGSLATADYYQTQYELLKSHTLATRVGQQLVAQGAHSPQFGQLSAWSRLAQWFGTRSAAKPAAGAMVAADAQALSEVVKDGLDIEPVRDSRLVARRTFYPARSGRWHRLP